MLKNKDVLKKYLAYDSQFLVVVINATKMVKDAQNIHNLNNEATTSLGKTLMLTTLMASMLKEETNKITVQIKGDKTIGNMVVCSDINLKTKGYISDGTIVDNKGYLNIIKDIGFKEPYVGFCDLKSLELEKDFEEYFTKSEQIETIVRLDVDFDLESNVEIATGYIIQALPDYDKKNLESINKIDSIISKATHLMADLDNTDDVVKTITGDNNVEVIYEKEPKYECDCNTDRIERTIIAIGKDDSMKILEENNNNIEVECHFCNKVYKYDKKMVCKLFE